nr:hypothetical protein [Prevotella intermedia]
MLAINALQNLLFGIPKAAVLHGKSVGFALQNSRFRSAKSKLVFFFGIILTKHERFCRCFLIAQLLFALPLDRWQKG